jgi:hypothetical protein
MTPPFGTRRFNSPYWEPSRLGRLKEYPKTHGRGAGCRCAAVSSPRWTPSPPGSTHRSCSPARAGGHLDLHNFRGRHSKPALRAAGLEYRRPYDLRHTYAPFSIAAGVSLVALARRMGTSLEMIDRTYGHLAPDADEYERGCSTPSTPAFLDRMDILWTPPSEGSRIQQFKRPRLRAFSGCARHDSNVRPLPPQGSALSPELRARDEGQCSGRAFDRPRSSSASAGTSART